MLDLLIENWPLVAAAVLVGVPAACLGHKRGMATGRRMADSATMTKFWSHFGGLINTQSTTTPAKAIGAMAELRESDKAALADAKPFTDLQHALLAREPRLPADAAWVTLPLRLAARRIADAAAEDDARGAEARLRSFLPHGPIAEHLHALADALAAPDPAHRTDSLAALATGDSGQRFDYLLMAALGLSQLRWSAELARIADALLLGEAALREAYAAHGFQIDRPRLFCPPDESSLGFVTEYRPGGAWLMPELGAAREAVRASLSTLPQGAAMVVEVARFGLRQEGKLLRATQLAGYNLAEWR